VHCDALRLRRELSRTLIEVSVVEMEYSNLTYLKLGNYKLSLFLNVNVTTLKNEIKRIIN